ncbi:Uma2 family endonuclease [Oscillatoria sp. CS-180]|uniref:Uma2 family endonuclease n=1 Tax=Oscillatoria sp. CS-180 TaxID=3021720 RepID=UPI00232DB872|nr:Uma2 family endonuclease [Oscillatoria sp. CS-180]MDB9529799.1 Uma2 family endonuclease [Oscillatoria sp. CS-180]
MLALEFCQLEIPAGQRLLLHNVGWAKFEAILEELGEHRGTRFTYDEGVLEIMAPSPEHEYFRQAISIAIEDIAEVLERDYECYGSTIWRRQLLQAGLEPDNCFYFQNEARVRGKLKFDLSQDPPPDLALDIDITSKSLDRFPIYARLGIPEIWSYSDGILTIYLLQQNHYVESESSCVFPSVKIQDLPQIIEQYRDRGRLPLRRAIKAWVKQQNQ